MIDRSAGKVCIMQMSDSICQGIVILTLSGRLTGSSGTVRFSSKVHEHLERKRKYFVVDMGKVTWMNSVGLGMLVSAVISVRSAKGRMVFANIDNVRELFTMVTIIRLLEWYDSVEEAIAGFSSTAKSSRR